MKVSVVTAPNPFISEGDARSHLRIDDDADDTLLFGFIEAATAHLDGPTGWLGRALGLQTLEARLSGFGSDPIRLPYAPVIEIESIRYQDLAGVWQTLDPATYELRDDELGTAWGATWPRTRAYRGSSQSVLIRYRAGYSAVPAPIKVAILLMVADLYKFRESVIAAATATQVRIPTTAETLLTPYRIYA